LKTSSNFYSIGLRFPDPHALKATHRFANDGGAIRQAVYHSVTLSPQTMPNSIAVPAEDAVRMDDDFFANAFEGINEAPQAKADAVYGQHDGPALGLLRGYLEDCSPDRIAGWAQNLRPGAPPVRVAIMLGRIVLADVVADKWRADLSAANIGTGHHAFEFRPVPPIARDLLGAIKVVRVADKVELPRVFELVNQ
jgi:hypothetical protein